MTTANDSITVTPGSGASVATHLVGGLEHQVVVTADEYGHIHGSAPAYTLFVPSQAAGASKVYWDLFNAAGSGKTLRVKSVEVVKNGATAVTGTVAVQLFLTRTSAIGTGGTAAASESALLTNISLNKMNPANASLPAGVTARLTPTGGATAGAVVSEVHVHPEETNAASYDLPDFLLPECWTIQPLIVPEGSGIRVVQGSVASVGNIGFNVTFEAV